MKKISNFLVEKRFLIFGIMVIFSIISIIVMNKVNINYDMTKYLPSDSNMKKGMEIMEKEFPSTIDSTLNIMFENLTEEEKETIENDLAKIKNVDKVEYEIDSEEYNKDQYTLYKLHIYKEATSKDSKQVYNDITHNYNKYTYYLGGDLDEIYTSDFTPTLLISILVIMMIILFTMSKSWFEPLLFIITILFAIILNKGTNIIFDSVSSITNSIAALLQLVLSMDYAVMLINRYRQEKQNEKDKIKAMKETINNSFKSISSSAITTITGLLILVFMTFTIGKDIGLVLAKGVFFSLLCVFTILPCLILTTDKILEKTSKKTININFKGLSDFSYKFKIVVTIVFVCLLCGAFYIKNNVNFTYTLDDNNKIDEIFPSENTIVVLYKNENKNKISKLIEELSQNENITTINDYSTTIGMRLNSTELAQMTGMDENLISQIFGLYFKNNGISTDGKVEMYDFINFISTNLVNDDNFKSYINEETKMKISQAMTMMDANKGQLVGENYSRMIINTSLEDEGAEINNLLDYLDKNLPEDSYVIGNSAMSYEMSKTFVDEFNFISILTAIAIFVVVAISFKSLIVPLILVVVIQTSIYLLMAVLNITDYNMYYLALLIVQGILMGATIDYAILFTSYYKEGRKKLNLKEGIKYSYDKSYHSILTSSLILICVTFAAGLLFENPTVGNICMVISFGSLSALLLIMFILPSLLCIFDKLIIKKLNKKTS